MLNDIYQKYMKKIFYGNNRVIKVQQVASDTDPYWVTEVESTTNNNKLIFKSKKVILATGARQTIP
jgi:hypothetical protein